MNSSSSSLSGNVSGASGGLNLSKPQARFSFNTGTSSDLQNSNLQNSSSSQSTGLGINNQTSRSPLGATYKNSSKVGGNIGNRKQTNRIAVDRIIEKVFLEPGNKAQIITNIQKVYSSRYGKFFNTRQDSSTAKENKNEYKKELEATFGKAGVILNGFLNRLYWVRNYFIYLKFSIKKLTFNQN